MTRFIWRRRRALMGPGLVAWFLSLPVQAEERLTSILARSSGASGAALTRVSITVDNYTPDSEAAAPLQAARSGGKNAVCSALRRFDRGFVSINGVRRSRINAARAVEAGNRRHIVVVATGALFGASDLSSAPATDDVFHVLELDLDERNTGTGQLIEAATVRLDSRGFAEADTRLSSAQVLAEVKPCDDKC